MALLEIVPALLCIGALSVFLVVKCSIPAGFAPLIVLGTSMLWFALFGIPNLLLAGGWLWYGLGGAACAATFAYKPQNNQYRRLAAPAFVFFLLAGLGVVLYLGIRKPLLHSWDEYTLWMSAAKMMKTNNLLYTVVPSGWAWAATQTPGLFSLGYFVQFFGSFAEWKVYAAYGLLYIAVVAALIGNLSYKQYKLAVPLAFVGMLVPWFFDVDAVVSDVRLVWLKSYGDLASGLLFGGVLLVYLGLRRAKAPLWPVGVLLAALSCIKENTFVLALVAAGILCCDFVFLGDKPTIPVLPFFTRLKRRFQKGQGPRRWPQPGRYPLAGRLGRAAVFMASAVLPLLVWNRYIGWVVAQRQQAGQVGVTNISPMQAMVKFFHMITGREEMTEQLRIVMRHMVAAFLGTKVESGSEPGKIFTIGSINMLGSPLITTLFIAGIFVAGILLASHSGLRKRGVLMLLLSAGGFAGYFLTSVVSYGLIIKYTEAVGLASFNRYMNAYFIGWFLLAVGYFALAARDGRPYGVAPAGLLALACGMLLLTVRMLPLQYSDVGYPDAFFNPTRKEQALAAAARGVMEGPSTNTFFVSQGDSTGQKWFRYSYQLLPVILDYSGRTESGETGGGGGTYGPPGEGEGIPQYHEYTPQMLQEYMTKEGIGYLFAETIDQRFVDAYAKLFTDGLEEALAGHTVLYRVQGEGASLRLVPVAMEVPPR